MSGKTLEQRRAAHALSIVKNVKQDVKQDKQKFNSYVERLPAAIVMNGLGQAMAMELANHFDWAHKELYDSVGKWLKECGIFGNEELMEEIISGDQNTYVRAQAEALAYLEWLKKFSQAYLKGDNVDKATVQTKN